MWRIGSSVTVHASSGCHAGALLSTMVMPALSRTMYVDAGGEPIASQPAIAKTRVSRQIDGALR
jgi:hypothetical protein